MSSEPGLEEALLEALESRIADVWTALPGKITKYYVDDQTVDVQIQVKDPQPTDLGTVKARSFPVLPKVPVAFPRGGGFFLSFPLQKGDYVLLVFSTLAIDQWRAKGSESHPGDVRRHSLTGAFAIPGIAPKKDALEDAHADDLVIGRDTDHAIHITPTDIALGSPAASDYVALAGLVLSELNAIKTVFDAHVHAGVTTGGGSSGPPATPLGAPGSVASDVVRST